MSEYTFEQARKAFSACQTLAAGAQTPIERKHWQAMEKAWRERMEDARQAERDNC
jgi:hypothetical protein